MSSLSPLYNSASTPSTPLPAPALAQRKGFWGWLLRLSLGVVILAALVVSGRLDLLVLMKVQVGAPLGLLIGVCVLALGANSLRWVCLVQTMGYDIPAWERTRVALASNVFLFISPAGTGADAARMFYLVHTHGVGMTRALACGLMDRLMGLQTLLLGAVLMVWLGGRYTTALTGMRLGVTLGALMSSGLLIGLALPSTRRLTVRLLPASWCEKLVDLGDGSRQTWSGDRLLTSYLLSLVGALANLTLPVFSLRALGVAIEGMSTYFGSALVVLVNSVAPTPGGLGAGEAVASELLGGTTGASAMLLARVLLAGVSLVFGLGYLKASIHAPCNSI